ncbi:hypothetical protein [Nesterenkonia jeotgali]|uniref:Uncharacterized protein n=1 Tax=Nesterenkonia jeotgali TaxID=317018 RepID=A0A839FRM6_9MICC|nr:hypothetical protein [Nesterenkonia jeotgali]MBA8921271.1 hypothetical protein [Nesterenkonia jeotgali]
MTNEKDNLAKSNQEQAVAAWVNHLNQIRLDTLLSSLRRQDTNLRDALRSIDEAVRTINLEVVFTNRGGVKGMHGFIAEVAEVGVGNARSQVQGQGAVYQWINNNSPVDLVREGLGIQQKFVASGGRLGLGAISEHLSKYPDFLADGGKYQIPLDHYEAIRALNDLPAEEAGKFLTRSGDGPSLKDWQRVRDFFADGSVSIDALEPSTLEYHQVQREVYESTLGAERNSLHSTDRSLRDEAYQQSRPSLRQAGTATATAAAAEGGAALVLALAAKRREGKKFKDFSEQDWIDVASATGLGAVQGSVRGVSLYALSNFTATPAAVASSIVTAGFGIAEQAHLLRVGKINELEFIQNTELISLEASVSALSSVLGQILVPVPVLGAVIGNTVGTVMYRAVSTSLSEREAALVERYAQEQRELDAQLASEQQELLEALESTLTDYIDLLERAFSPDVEIALAGSVELAVELGVDSEDVLDSQEKVSAYFLD